MGRKLPPDQLELYRRCDEVLHYVWDPCGVAGAPGARDEYDAYLPAIYRLLVQGAEKEQIVQALVEIEVEAMGLSGSGTRAGAAVDALLKWRERNAGSASEHSAGDAVLSTPGQVEPTSLEAAILERIAAAEAGIAPYLDGLHVVSREFTGVGSFTTFLCEDASTETRPVSLDGHIAIPGLAGGMGAVLFCVGDRPKLLETFTYGSERWDGDHAGFRVTASGRDG